MTSPSNWYENFFHGIPLDLWRKAISPEQTKAETEFLVKSLDCGPGSHLLDVPCGNGRLSLELARRGYQVTGVDISEEFVEEARSSVMSATPVNPPNAGDAVVVPAPGASDPGETPVPQFLLGDMRCIEGDATYDGAFCFGNSFGFLEYGDMETFLKRVARALKPGARFIVETGMAAESVLPKFEEETSHQIDDMLLTIKERYLAEESCIDTEYIFERNGKTEMRKAKHWIYTVAEIRRMVDQAGLEVLELFGSLKGEPFVLRSDELYIVAQRPFGVR